MTPPLLDDDPVAYRGYILMQTAGGRWLAQHEEHGAEVTATPDGTALMFWRSMGALRSAIDKTFIEPGDEA